MIRSIFDSTIFVLSWCAMLLMLAIAISNEIPNTPKTNTVFIDQNAVE